MAEKGKNHKGSSGGGRAGGGEPPEDGRGNGHNGDGPEDGSEDGEGLWQHVARSVRPLWAEERRRMAALRAAPPSAPQSPPPKGGINKAGEKARGETPRHDGPPASRPQERGAFLEKLLHETFLQGRKSSTAAGEEPLQHPGLGLDRASARKLKRGRMVIDGRIDLHGHDRLAAYERLAAFLQDGYERGWRCVLVITGKGRGGDGGVLRAALPRWVAEQPLTRIVLRIETAQPQDGGAGAFYILLRRQREE